MINNKTLFVLAGIALLAIGFVLGVVGMKAVPSTNLGGTSYDRTNLVGDVYQGLNSVLMMSAGVFVGPINSSGAVTLSGTSVLSGTASVTGSLTSECTKFYAKDATTSASSTYYISVNTEATTTGFAYIVQATSTKPALCP